MRRKIVPFQQQYPKRAIPIKQAMPTIAVRSVLVTAVAGPLL